MDIDIITSGLIGIATTGAGYFFGRRKNNAEAASQEIANVSKLFEFYDKALDDIKLQVKTISQEKNELSKQVSDLSKERGYLFKQIGDLNLKVASLMKFSCVNMACKQRLTDLRVLDLGDENKEESKKEE